MTTQSHSKFTVKYLLEAQKNNKIARISSKCGTSSVGGIFVFTDYDNTSFIVVGQDAYFKFNGSAQKAACYGVKNVDYHIFASVKDAAKYANKLLKALIKKQEAHLLKIKNINET